MKFWIPSTLLTVSLLLLSGCGGFQPAPPDKAVIDTSLPNIVLTSHGKIVAMKSVAFEWKSLDNPKVIGVYVYKKAPSSKEIESELKYYTTVDSRFKTHFVDTHVTPDTRYSYAFKTFSDEAEGRLSKEVVVNTLPVLQSVSWIDKITGLPRVAKIIWRPHANAKVKAYIIERKTLDDEKWEEIETINGRLNAEFIDEGLKDNYVYMYRVRVLTFDNIISTPSKIVKVVTKALPLSITNIKATRSLPKEIKITWSKSVQDDFAIYHLYRSSEIDGHYELIAILHNNKFTDKVTQDGKTYFYRVSAIDKDSLESIHDKNSIQGMTLSRPESPALVEAKLLKNSIELRWSKTDPRSISYTVVKKHKKGWFDEKEEMFENIKSNLFVDKEIEPNSTYTYKVFSVDKNGIESKLSSEAVVITPESTEIVSAPKTTVKKEVHVIKSDKEETVVVATPVEIIEESDDLDLSGL